MNDNKPPADFEKNVGFLVLAGIIIIVAVIIYYSTKPKQEEDPVYSTADSDPTVQQQAD